METIDVQIGVGMQTVIYTEILAGFGAKLKIRIVSDGYAFQSNANVFRWDGNQWIQVHTIHHSLMKTQPCLYTADKSRQQDPTTFKADRDQLLKVVGAILE